MSLHVVIAGSSGFLGSNLREELLGRGHRVTRLVRRTPSGTDEAGWDPQSGEVDADVVQGADVVVNLAASPTFGNPHSARWATALRHSRVTSTRLLAQTIAAGPAPRPAYLSGNGVSWYGDHGPAELTEESDTRGHALLTEVTRDWQAAADPAVAAGARVCVLRTAPVMDRRNAPLSLLRPLFRAGLGGPIGSGRQYMPQISLRDWVGAVAFLAEHASASGPVNLCCPVTPTNAEFTSALAAAVHRPAFARVPAPAVRLAAGPMAPEVLGSLNARPAALERWGYEFSDPDVRAVLATGLS
jgi:uncharacterized protein